MKKRKDRISTIILGVVFLAGLSLLLYPSVSNYVNEKHQTKTISDYSRKVDSLDDEEYEALWEEAKEYNEKLSDYHDTHLLSNARREEYESLLNINGDGVMGSMITASNFEVYSPMPFMVKLPVENTEAHNWEYELTVVPKFEKGDDLLLKIGTDGFSIVNGIMPKRVIKVWDDEGYEAIRPEQVEIKLLKDGEVFDTKILSKKTNWRCSWNRLDSSSEWSIVETPIEHYSPLIVHEGGTYTVTNRYVPAISEGNPPVNKKVIGNPDKPGTFEFVMKAQDASFPMPEGSTAGEKTISITGAGSCEFGEMTFDKAGTYVYTMSEKDLAEKGYTYDSNVFTVTFVVTEKDGKLETVRTIKDGNGKDAEYVEFTNEYKSQDPLPYTGILWWPVPVLLAVGLACILVGVIRRRGKVTEA